MSKFGGQYGRMIGRGGSTELVFEFFDMVRKYKNMIIQ